MGCPFWGVVGVAVMGGYILGQVITLTTVSLVRGSFMRPATHRFEAVDLGCQNMCPLRSGMEAVGTCGDLLGGGCRARPRALL